MGQQMTPHNPYAAQAIPVEAGSKVTNINQILGPDPKDLFANYYKMTTPLYYEFTAPVQTVGAHPDASR